MDIGLHIMFHYPVWAEQREKILKMIGIRRNYKAVVGAIVASARNWAIFVEYCEIVMRRKEEEEGERQCSAAMA